MPRLHASFILAYHGCSADVGQRIVNGEPMDASNQAYDWLGSGIYFWEADPWRAWEWADGKVSRGDFEQPFVIGAAIDLGNCLDFLSRESIVLLEKSYHAFAAIYEHFGIAERMPVNQRGGKLDEDYLKRYLDCAVIRYLHLVNELAGDESFDTVRGLFTEGGQAFPGSGFKKKTHVQIAVRNTACIKGLFRMERP